MPFGYTLVPRDLYDVMLEAMREKFEPIKREPVTTGFAQPEPREPEPDFTITTAATVAPDPADVLVALDNGQTVGVPSVVVNACIHEARGNDVVLERQLVIAARSLSLGMDPQHVAMQMRAGEQVEV